MKIIYVVETYTKGLGYIDNVLPKELAKKGHSVDVITCGLPVYYQNGKENSLSNDIDDTSEVIEKDDFITLHTMNHIKLGNRILIKDLDHKLNALQPDIVIVRGIASPVLAQVIYSKIKLGFDIITSSGMAYSALPKELRSDALINIPKFKNLLTRFLPGRLFSFFIKKCIASSVDGVDVVADFYGVPRRKITMISLGVDTELFFPALDESTQAARESLRIKLGYSDDTILCIWTGRITQTKGVDLLAQAIDELNREGKNFKALFIGDGPCVKDLTAFKHSQVINFKPWNQLPNYYRCADIAVWPKSITTSTLDAASCGLPIIMSDQEKAVERWENAGSSYREGDVDDLKKTLCKFEDQENRNQLKKIAFNKMESLYSWRIIAEMFENEFK